MYRSARALLTLLVLAPPNATAQQLVNSSPADAGHGYWFPSATNDGATGGGFMPEAVGRGWLGKTTARGAWYYSGEEDVGYCAALRTHATILTRDPVFGEIAYGGVVTRQGDAVSVVPRDGLRVRFHVVRGDQRLHMTLERDGYAKERPVIVQDDLSRIEFTLENRWGRAHEARLDVRGLPAGRYDVVVDGRRVRTVRSDGGAQTIALPLTGAHPAGVVIGRQTR